MHLKEYRAVQCTNHNRVFRSSMTSHTYYRTIGQSLIDMVGRPILAFTIVESYPIILQGIFEGKKRLEFLRTDVCSWDVICKSCLIGRFFLYGPIRAHDTSRAVWLRGPLLQYRQRKRPKDIFTNHLKFRMTTWWCCISLKIKQFCDHSIEMRGTGEKCHYIRNIFHICF